MTRAELKKLRQPARRRKWARRLFLPVVTIGPLILVAIFTALDSNASFEDDFFTIRAKAIASEYDAIVTTIVPGEVINLAIPDSLTNDTARGIHSAVRLFHRLCTLGGPNMVLEVFRMYPEYEFIGGAPDTLDAGEMFREVHRGIPSSKNPMTLEWTTELINGDPFE